MKKKNINLKKIVLRLYELCLKIYLTDNKIAQEYKNEKIRCPVHLSLGQEAAAAAIGCIMTKKDFVFSGHRSHAHYIVKNGSINKMIAELYGKKTGCSKGNGGSMHLIDEKVNFMGSTAIVANSIPVGVGYALGNQIKKRKSKTFIFFGDGAVEEGVFFESLNFSALKKLNIVFVCENNKYSVYSHMKLRQPKKRQIYKLSQTIGIPSFKINSTDPLNIFQKVYNILKKKKEGPIFFEISTFRNIEHCGPNNDDHLNYRPRTEIDFWKKNNFFKIFRRKKHAKYLDFKNKERIENNLKIIINKAFKLAKNKSK